MGIRGKLLLLAAGIADSAGYRWRAQINQLFDSIELSPQVIISVVDSDGRILYRRRGSEALLEADVSWAPLSSVLTNERTNVVELTSPIDGVKRVYGMAHVRETGLVAMIGIPSSTLYEPARRRLIRYGFTGLIALLLALVLARVLQRSGLTEEEQLDYAKTIAIECDRQIEFVGNLLDLSRIESGAYKLRKTRVVLRELMGSSVDVERHHAESLGLTLTTDVPQGLPSLRGDTEALRRVICGLIDNAIKYTPEGGRITVSARETVEGMAIHVSDTGKGIPEVDLPHVFEKFYRVASEAPGVGLGLYLAQHIVTQLDGQISVASKQGIGTTFTIVLPLAIEEVAIERREEEVDAKAFAGS